MKDLITTIGPWRLARSAGLAVVAAVLLATLAVPAASARPRLALTSLIGGASIETGQGLAIGRDGAIYFGGETESDDFGATSGAAQEHRAGAIDGFVMKLTPDGRRVLWATYLGGTSWDAVHRQSGLAIDRWGDVYVTGFTLSPDFPVKPAAPPKLDLSRDAYVTKLDGDTGRIEYSTLVGGSGADGARDIEVDATGAAYITGITDGRIDAYGPPYLGPGGPEEAYVAKLSPEGRLVDVRYLGGAGAEDGQGLVLDEPRGLLHLIGFTTSSNFPVTADAADSQLGGDRDVFVARLGLRDGLPVEHASYLGGAGTDGAPSLAAFSALNIDTDASGDVHVVGSSNGDDLPGDRRGQAHNAGGFDTFVAKLDHRSHPAWLTYLGGDGDDWPNAVAVAPDGSTYVLGRTRSTDFPRVLPLAEDDRMGDPRLSDAYVAKVAADGRALKWSTTIGAEGFDSFLTADLTPAGDLFIAGAIGSGGLARKCTGVGNERARVWDASLMRITDDKQEDAC